MIFSKPFSVKGSMFAVPLLFVILITTLVLRFSGIFQPSYENQRAITEQFVYEPTELVDLFSEETLSEFYSEHSGYPVYANTAGVYTIKSYGGDIYFGMSGGSPGNYDGALLAKYSSDQERMYPVLNQDGSNPIKEQGLHDMIISNDILYIPGTDPCCISDEWDYGNLYTLSLSDSSASVVLHRNLPNTLHSLGIDVVENTVYLGTGTHIGDYKTWEGSLFIGNVSIDDPQQDQWYTYKASDYRMYDVKKLGNTIYAFLSSASLSHGTLVASYDEGKNWETVTTEQVTLKPRLLKFGGKLLATATFNTNGILSIDSQGRVEKHPVPESTLQVDGAWQTMTTDGNAVYALSYKGIISSIDLVDWYLVYPLDAWKLKPVAIEYWKEREGFVIATSGDTPSLYFLDRDSIKNPQKLKDPKNVYVSFGFNGEPQDDVNPVKNLSYYFMGKGYSVSQILKWNPQYQVWASHMPDFEFLDFGDNFTIAPTDGLLILFTDNGKIPNAKFMTSLSQKVKSTSPGYTYDLLPGYNFVSFPSSVMSSSTSKVSTVCKSFNSKEDVLSSILQLEKVTEVINGKVVNNYRYVTYKCSSISKDITIRPNTGYFLDMNSAASVYVSKNGVAVVDTREETEDSEI